MISQVTAMRRQIHNSMFMPRSIAFSMSMFKKENKSLLFLSGTTSL